LHDYGLRLHRLQTGKIVLEAIRSNRFLLVILCGLEEMPKREMHYGYIGLRNTIGFCLTYPNAPSCSEPSAKRIFIQMEDTITKLMVEGSPIGLDGPQ
jgi:hypothetical protein